MRQLGCLGLGKGEVRKLRPSHAVDRRIKTGTMTKIRVIIFIFTCNTHCSTAQK
jgi:hypothetical protein